MARPSLAAAALALALAAASAAAGDLAAPRGVMTLQGQAAPALRLADSEGRPADLADLRGRWVFVHFWASWCGPCRREMPTIQRLTATLDDRWRVLLVNTAEGDDEVFAFLSTVAPDLATLMDRDGAVTAAWQPRGLPSTFLVDPAGRLRYLALGGRPWDTPPYAAFLRELAGPAASFK